MRKEVKRNQWKTGDQLYIHTVLLQKVKWRKKNLAMVTYDMVPHSLVIEALNMIDIAKNVVNFFGKKMKSLWVKLTCGVETLREVPTKRKIFQGDALSTFLLVIALIPLRHILRTANLGYEFRTGEAINHLLLIDKLNLYSKSERAMDSLIHPVTIFSEDSEMQFGIDKCAMLVMKKGEISEVRRYWLAQWEIN